MFENKHLFFYLVFLSGTFTIHRTAGKGGDHLFKPSLPLPHASETLRLDISRLITAESSTHASLVQKVNGVMMRNLVIFK